MDIMFALFEDQVGKFDWTARHLGCYNQVHFGRSESAEEFLLVSSEKNIVGRLNVNTGDLVWRQINEQTVTHPPTFTVTDSAMIVSINNGLYSRTFDKNTGVLKSQKRGQATDTARQSETSLKIQKSVEKSLGFTVSTVQLIDSHQLLRGPVSTRDSLDRTNVFAVSDKYNPSAPTDSPVDLLFAAYYEAQRIVRIYDLISSSLKQAPVKSIHFLASVTGSYQMLVTRKDCEVDFYEATVNSMNEGRSQPVVDANLEWVRFEGLASISSVEMVDLPLSESQARIETEFGSVNVPIWKSLFLRISSQLEQLQRAFVGLGNRVVESFEMFTSKRATMASVLRHFLGYDERRVRRRSNGQDKAWECLTLLLYMGGRDPGYDTRKRLL
uniref:ER membrane protein complex subunit 1 n=1 Tax=Ditylenchus dipsaci TaxID=166011 RepID=A0A915CS37_9BILA